LERSLTVLLPVCNVQSTLAVTVLEILEVVSDLTDQFDLVIIDDGSADATSEVAHELTQHYPQVRAVRHGRRLGREAAIRAGLKQSKGELIVVPDETGNSAAEDIRRLWRLADQPQRTAGPVPAPTARKWTRFSPGHPMAQSGYQLIDRRTMEHMHSPSQPDRPNYLSRLKDFALGQ
jgi:cellulose synthase/poly-beta-1,6-N-acetylglucosamine synthase-like glycosyltransferase